MLKEAVDALQCTTGKLYVDCTVGGAGHSSLIANKIQPDGKLICLDVDDDAIKQAKEKLKSFPHVHIIKTNYKNIHFALLEAGEKSINGGILADLGTSFHQLTSAERGFSFSSEAMLDMRMDQSLETSAYELINQLSESELVNIFSKYGEEKYSKRIAKAIIEEKSERPIKTTSQLAELVKRSTPKNPKQKIHPATRVFQALRIAVNDELSILEESLTNFLTLTEPGARIAIITFHSLEDRIVKKFFNYWSSSCICYPKLAKCLCGHTPKLKIINKKPIVASEEEINSNPPSRSAKLRIAERL